MQELARAAEGARGASSARSTPSCDAGARLAAQPARPDRGRRGRVAARGRRGRAPTGRDHLELAGGLIDMEAGARVAGSRFAYLQRRPRAARARARALGDGGARRPRVRAGRSRPCSCARRRSTAPASCPTPSSRSTAWPTTRCTSSGTSEVRAGLAARRRDPRRRPSCRCATPASPPASAARRAPPGSDTRGIFRVHQFDKVEMFCVRRAGGVARDEHERLLGDRGGAAAGARDPLPRGQHRRRRPGRLGGQEVRLRGVDARPGALPRGHLDARTRPTTRRAASTSATAQPAAGPRHVATLNGTAVTWRHMIAHPRERPARGRLGRDPRGAAPAGVRRPCCG